MQMPRKPKPFMVLETKEQFEKMFNDVFNSGKEDGFKEGLAAALSLILDVQDKLVECDKNVVTVAAYMQKDRHIREFDQRQKLYESIRKAAVKEYLEKHEEDDLK